MQIITTLTILTSFKILTDLLILTDLPATIVSIVRIVGEFKMNIFLEFSGRDNL